MSWISDLSANRFNNTYFRDAHGTGFAVDMSGDLVVRGQIRNEDTDAVDISGDLVVRNGNVGIGTTSPTNKLQITDGACMVEHTGANNNSLTINPNNHSNGVDIEVFQSDNLSEKKSLCLNPYGGNVGIGTTNPYAKFHIAGAEGSVSLAQRSIFRYDSTELSRAPGDWSGLSIYAKSSIATSNFFVAVSGTISASDVRIKNAITDVVDDSALTMLRALNPKTYGYNDVMNRGTEVVYGFIAQEVGEIIPQSVKKTQDSIPNVYQLATVGNDNKTMCFYQGFNTQDLDASSNTLKILDKETNEHFVNIEEIIDASHVRIDTDLSNMMGDIDASDNIVEGNKVFVYGQRVDDFHFLKKDAIWTVATAALQEVDRQLQAEKTKVATLESQLADVLTRLTALESA